MQFLPMRIGEHRKWEWPEGQLLLECGMEIGGTNELKSEVID